MLTLTNLLQVIDDRSQELALSVSTTAEKVRYLNLSLKDIRLRHDFEEAITTTSLAFVRSSTKGYAAVTNATDFWAPIELNNADDDYHFHYMHPKTLKELDGDPHWAFQSVEKAFAKQGADMLIYHDETETLTLKYYSKNLVYDDSASAWREDFVAADTDDYFLVNNDEPLIVRTLMFLMEKEPKSKTKYDQLKANFDEVMGLERYEKPSQRLDPAEPLEFIG